MSPNVSREPDPMPPYLIGAFAVLVIAALIVGLGCLGYVATHPCWDAGPNYRDCVEAHQDGLATFLAVDWRP